MKKEGKEGRERRKGGEGGEGERRKGEERGERGSRGGEGKGVWIERRVNRSCYVYPTPSELFRTQAKQLL